MKKQLLFVVFSILVGFGAMAQQEKPLPNTDFENWTLDENTGDFEPDSYISIDQLIASFLAPGIADQVKRGSLLDVHSGDYSVVLTGDTVPTPFGTFPLPGAIFLASSIEQFDNGGLGVDYDVRPTQIKGWYKYKPNGDTCQILVIPSKFNEETGERENMGIGEFSSSDTVNAFTEFTININYNPEFENVTPDTLSMIIASNPVNFGNPGGDTSYFGVGATLVVDDLSVKIGTVVDFATVPSRTLRAKDSITFNLIASGPYNKVRWFIEDSTIVNKSSFKYVFNTQGTYNVKVELLNDKDSVLASNNRNLIVQASVGINNTSKESSTAFLAPNPAVNYSQLTYQAGLNENIVIKIADVTGKIVRTFNEGTRSGLNKFIIATNDLPNGLYFVNISNGEKVVTKKLTVNK